MRKDYRKPQTEETEINTEHLLNDASLSKNNSSATVNSSGYYENSLSRESSDWDE